MILVHGNRSHPPIGRVRVIGASLKDGRSSSRPSGISELVPTNRSMLRLTRTACNRDVSDQRFLRGIAAEVPIGQTVHQPEIEVVEVISRSCRCRLRHAVAMIVGIRVIDARRGVPGNWDLGLGQRDRRVRAPRHLHSG